VIPESEHVCEAKCDRTAVIFIHGLTGSRDTWYNEKTHFFWPQQLATDVDVSNGIDVYRVDYDSYLFGPSPPFVDILTALEGKLDSLFELHQYPKAVIVAHSLGGNVARAYLLHVKARFGHRALSSFRMIYTFGTPMEGSSLAAVARLASSNPQIRVLQPIKVNDFLQLLNLTLEDVVNKHHDVYCPPLIFFAGYEQRPVPGIWIIVSQRSATLHANVIKAFDKNHIDMVKPGDRRDPAYQWVKDGIVTCLKDSATCPSFMTPDCGNLPEGYPTPSSEVTTKLRKATQHP
jgi:pimeloyl-ACP methyl ester carboxylesterase